MLSAFSRSMRAFIAKNIRQKETLPAFFRRITGNENSARALVKLILRSKRSNHRDFKAIYEAFGSPAKFSAWFFDAKGYQAAYYKYFYFLWDKASRPEDIIKQLPNVNPWSLLGKFKEIRIGSIPEEFGSEENFISLLEQMAQSDSIKAYHEIKRLECSDWEGFTKRFPQVRKINIFDFGQKAGFFKEVLQQECGRPFQLKAGGKTFTVKFLCNPFSCKLVTHITAPGGQAFILKSLPFDLSKTENDRQVKERENHAIRADSSYANALLEFYLKLNKCPNAPDICYYNYKYDAALYRQEEGKAFNFDDKPAQMRSFYEFNRRMVPDVNKLGVYLNDINSGNFIVSDRDGRLKIIDIGHAGYSNPLNPGVSGLCFSFGNLCGYDFLYHCGSIIF